MAKRKKKEPLNELLGYVLMIIFICVFLVKDSIWQALAVVFGVFIAMLIVLRTKDASKRNRINQSGILEVDKMTGIQFEQFLMVRYSKMGYKVKETPTTGDFGADLVLSKDATKIVVQAKCYSKSVGIKAVQEAFSAKEHYKSNEAWVVTNNYFTKAAKKLAESTNVRLIDRDQLIHILLS